jgi:hypothetical protein
MMKYLLSLALLLFAASAWAQDVVSGPTKGEKVPALMVFDATGTHKDKDVDYAADRKDKPTLYVFIQADKFSRPMNRFLKVLDGKVKEDLGEYAYIVAVWLTDKPDTAKEFLPRVQQSVQYETTALTCFTGDKTGPKDWNVNADAHLTAVVANKGKVVTNFGYNSINETDVPKVREALKKAK